MVPRGLQKCKQDSSSFFATHTHTHADNTCLRLQALTDRFSLKIRRLAASDHIVKTAGVTGYAQLVLVPELAMRLVKEDMGVSDDSARQILRDSMVLGAELNPELNDAVPVPAEEEKHHAWDQAWD